MSSTPSSSTAAEPDQGAIPGGAPVDAGATPASPGRFSALERVAAGFKQLGARLRGLRARFYYVALDAVYTSPVRKTQPAQAFLHEALTRSGNFHRVGALARYLSAHAPEGMARVRRALERLDHVPMRVTGARPLGYGSVTSCVLLDESSSHVLKFRRYSLGRDLDEIMAICRRERGNYESLRRWYAGIPRLLPHTIHLVLNAPVRGAPAAAQIQEMIVGEPTDLLADHSDDELVDLLERHDALREHFRIFVAGTRRAWDEEGRFVDMVGRYNVALLAGPDGPELKIADFGIWDLEVQKRQRPDLHARAVEALARLERIAARVADHTV